jgi:hypothetical protein
MASRARQKPWWQRRCPECGQTLCPEGYCVACVQSRREARRLRDCGTGFRAEPVTAAELEGGPR